MFEAEEVALRALIYRECYLQHRTSLLSILDDSECAPGTLSFLTLLAAEKLTDYDWALLTELVENDGKFLRLARAMTDARYAEVLLHAKPPNGVQSKQWWAQPFRGDRWDEIEILMAVLERSGTTTTHEDLESSFSQAWRQLTGGDIDDYLDACEQYEDTAA